MDDVLYDVLHTAVIGKQYRERILYPARGSDKPCYDSSGSAAMTRKHDDKPCYDSSRSAAPES